MDNHGQNRGGSPGSNAIDFAAVAAELRARIDELESSVDARPTVIHTDKAETITDEVLFFSEAGGGVQDPMCNCSSCKAERRLMESRASGLCWRCGNPQGLHICL